LNRKALESIQDLGFAALLFVGLALLWLFSSLGSSCSGRSPTYSAPAPEVTGSQDRRDAEQFVRNLPSGCHGSVSGDSPAYVDYRCDNGTTGQITLQNGRVMDVR